MRQIELEVVDLTTNKDTLHIEYFTKREENQEEENSRIYETLKFKDPRDALNFFVKKWELFPEKVLLRVMDYIEYGSTLEGEKQFSQHEFYYYIILKFQIYSAFELENIINNQINNLACVYEIDRLHKALNLYFKEKNRISRASHLWAVANTRILYLRRYNKITTNNAEIFIDFYKDKSIKFVEPFCLVDRLWKIHFNDDIWIIAGDRGNGQYQALTDFNSYKMIY